MIYRWLWELFCRSYSYHSNLITPWVILCSRKRKYVAWLPEMWNFLGFSPKMRTNRTYNGHTFSPFLIGSDLPADFNFVLLPGFFSLSLRQNKKHWGRCVISYFCLSNPPHHTPPISTDQLCCYYQGVFLVHCMFIDAQHSKVQLIIGINISICWSNIEVEVCFL